tara:strand:- start:199 stop:447 length:249 start_codon:yes stop_codon:yes gene_type:complete
MRKNNLSEDEIISKIKNKIKRIKVKNDTINKIYDKTFNIINKYSDKSKDEKIMLTITILEQLIREADISQDEKNECMNNLNV